MASDNNTIGSHSIANSMGDKTSQKTAESTRTGSNGRAADGTGPRAASGGNVETSGAQVAK